MVDFGTSMHMVSKKDPNSAELETMKTSRSPTTVMTTIGEVRTNKGATAFLQFLYSGSCCATGRERAPQRAVWLSEMLLHGREYRKSFLPTMGARCHDTLPDSTDVQREMRVPELFVGEARSLAADGGTPEYHGDACDALRRPELLGGPLHICKLRRVFVVHGERLRVGHEERSNGATSSQQWQSSSASVREHETEIHAHPRDAAETGHGG